MNSTHFSCYKDEKRDNEDADNVCKGTLSKNMDKDTERGQDCGGGEGEEVPSG